LPRPAIAGPPRGPSCLPPLLFALPHVKLKLMAKPLAKLVTLITPQRQWAQFSLDTMFVVVAALGVWLAVRANRANNILSIKVLTV
jgi:hypothetical protein